METNRKIKSIFPMAVSGMLLIFVIVILLFVMKLQSHIFVSYFDRLAVNLFSIFVILLSICWMLIMVIESFGITGGRFYRPMKWLLFFIYYPLARVNGWIFRIGKETIQTSLLDFQNILFVLGTKLSKHSKILLLLPHCLQYHDCKVRITRDINDCENCGECDICNLKDLGSEYDIAIGVATGGTLARKIVQDAQPDAIIAVACHRDLTDGVRESWKYPVYGILNERPFGPCFDTKVDVALIEEIIRNTKQTK